MIKRALLATLKERIDFTKVLLLSGPRQVGKTTLSKMLLEELGQEAEIFNGDTATTKMLWRVDEIESLKQSFGNKKIVVLDEAQMVEDVGHILKILVDAQLGIQFIVTGSSALDIANKTQEPLTGRKWEYRLYPFSIGELMAQFGVPKVLEQLPQYMLYGMYPEVINHPTDAKEILNNLTSSYLFRDILALTGVKKPFLLEKILKALALQVGNEVSLNELANLVQADAKTVDNYIYLLEQSYIVYRLGTISRNERKEISTKKKIYFYDLGIRNALLGNYTPIHARGDLGALWENFLITERKKTLAYNGFYGRTYFWRNKLQAEVDYVEEIDGQVYAYEFKWSEKAKAKFPKPFLDTYQPAVTKVIHRENFWQWLNEYSY